MPSHVSSPDALGVVRNLTGGVAGAALHPPVVPARAVLDLQDGPEESRIARVTVLALPRVAEGGRVIGVEPNTGGITVGKSIKGWPPPPLATVFTNTLPIQGETDQSDAGAGPARAAIGICCRPVGGVHWAREPPMTRCLPQ